ncbi:MAG: TIGR02099 family protein [Rhodanobacteraceae bacterium]|nr:TIGR02099 family protein [Rhodanobacteraceae bacterium]
MKTWHVRLRRLRFALLATAAAVVILLGVLAGLTQLAMPWLEHHPQHVERWLSERLGRSVQIGRVGGRWIGGGPRLALEDVRIASAGGGRALAVPRAELVFDLSALFSRSRRLTEFHLAGLDLQLVNDAGIWRVGGLDVGGVEQGGGGFSMGALGAIEIRDFRLAIDDPQRDLHLAFAVPVLRLLNNGAVTRVLGRIRLDAPEAPLFDLVADLDIGRRGGRIYVGGRDVDFAKFATQQSPGGVQLLAGRGAVQVWVGVHEARADDVRVKVDLADARLGAVTPIAADARVTVAPRAGFDRLAFVARWLRTADGWSFDLADFTADREVGNLPARVSIERHGGEAQRTYRAAATELPLEPLGDLAMLTDRLPADWRRWLYLARPRGTLARADFGWNGGGDYSVGATLRGLGLASVDVVPGIERLDLDLAGDAQALLLQLPAQALRVDYPRVFRRAFVFSRFGGDVVVRRADDGWRLETDRLAFEGDGYGGEARGGVDLRDGHRPSLDLYGTVTHGEVAAAKLFWPVNVMSPLAVAWLDRALVAGRIVEGRIAFRGDLEDWPFHNDAGRMIARAEIADATLDYHPEWPRAEKLHAVATFVNTGLQVDGVSAEAMGNRVGEASATIADFGEPLLDLAVKGEGSGANLLGFLRATPIGKRYRDQLKDVAVGGRGAVTFTLDLPLKDVGALTLDGHVALTDAKLDHAGYDLHFTGASGPLRFNQHGFAADGLDAVFRGGQSRLSLTVGGYVADPQHVFEASVAGRFATATVFADVPVLAPGFPKFPGESDWSANVSVDAASHARLVLTSDLVGTSIELPAPLAKTAAEALPFRLDLDLPYAGTVFEARLGDVLGLKGRLPGAGQVFALRADFGPQPPAAPPPAGIAIGGRMATLDVGGWLDLVDSGSSAAAGGLLQGIDVVADDFLFGNRHFSDMRLAIGSGASATTVRLDGAALAGSLDIPRLDPGGRGIRARFARIHWPEAPAGAPETDAAALADVAPVALPPLHLTVEDFRLGSASFGSAQFDSHPVAGGMQIDTLKSHSPNVTMSASGTWTGTPADNRSRMTIELSAQNLGHMMDALGFPGLIDGGTTRATIDASWPGPPSAFALPRLDGTLGIDVAEGRILEVEPGAGRIFGLLSLTEIPRRLSLDFSDFFRSGLSFSSIKGTFRLGDGNAWTDGLTIKSPAADIVVSGRTGLRAKDYDQEMDVSPHAGSTLPVVGAIAAGPVGAAAGLVMQGILNKPLGKAIGSRYHVSGSWDKPKITLIAREKPPAPPAPPAPKRSVRPADAPDAAQGP